MNQGTIEEENEEEELNEEEQKRKGNLNKNEGNKKTGFLGGLFGGGENNYFVSDPFADVKKCVYEKMPKMLIACILCWNHMELFNWNDYHFTRHGVFAYYPEDNRRINDRVRIKLSQYQKLGQIDKYEE